MKIYCISSTIIAMASLLLSCYIWRKSINGEVLLDAATPKEAVLKSMNRFQIKNFLIDESAFWNMHGDEILKTVEVVEVNEQNGVAVAFKRHTIGAKVFRQHLWLRKVENKWFVIPFVSEHGDKDETWYKARSEWMASQFKKIKDWEHDSATKWD